MSGESLGKTFDIELEGITVHVTHKRVKRINMRIAPDGSAQMSVPLGTPYELVLKVARENAEWFREMCGRAQSLSDITSLNNYTIDVGGITVHVTHKRVKNFNMRITREGTAELSAPMSAARTRVEQVARDHEDWFRQALADWERRSAASPDSFADGDSIKVWGRDVRLSMVETTERPHCTLEGDVLYVHVPKGASDTARELCVEQFLEAELKKRVNEILAACVARVGAAPKSITLRRMKSRWGSCTKGRGTIRLNVALAEYPPECTECVLCHELCHLFEANHGPRFDALLEKAYPNWRIWQGYLDERSPRS